MIAMFIQKMLKIHDFLYASVDLIPSNSFDGKDQIKEVYIITDEHIQEIDAYDTITYETYEEAEEELQAMQC
jgi:hypothetical protein